MLARPEEVYEHCIEFPGGQEGREADQEAAGRELASWRRSQGTYDRLGGAGPGSGRVPAGREGGAEGRA